MNALSECDGKTAAIGIFFDAEKAYDMCPHEGIISSLAVNYNIAPLLLHTIRSFLSNRKQTVRVENAFSSMRNVKSGVPQGSIIASLLFVAFMAPVQRIQFSHGASTVGYADDLCYLRTIQEHDDKFQLNDIELDINKIKEVVTDLKMKLNVSKTKAIVFSVSPSLPSIPSLRIDQETIEQVSTYKYLGVWLDRKLAWSEHAKKKIGVAKQALGTLSRCRRYLPPTVSRLVYKTVIQPTFLYAAATVYPKHKKDQIAYEWVNKYAASLISDFHTGSYDECIKSAGLDPVWKIAAKRRLLLFHSYVDKRRFIPEEFLHAKELTAKRQGLRSEIVKPDENKQQFEKPINSQRQQCESTALSLMINQWNNLPNSLISLNPAQFKKHIKNDEMTKYLIDAKVLNPLEVPVQNPTWSIKRKNR
jgi:hypothetical protein